MYRKWKESGGAEDEYKTIIVAQVKKSQEDAKRDGVKSNHELNNLFRISIDICVKLYYLKLHI